MKIPRLRIVATAIGAVFVLQICLASATTTNVVQAGLNYSQLNIIQKRLISTFAEDQLNPQAPASQAPRSSTYFPTGDDGCPKNYGDNVKVNQNCLNLTDADLQGRGQANNETSIAIDPFHPDNMVASYNDYRRGDGNCYTAYSTNQGNTWTDSTPPTGFTRGSAFGAARQYWQAGGDTSVAWDTKGNAYLSCQLFQRGQPATPNPDVSSAFYVFRSTHNNGASWNFPGHAVIESPDVKGSGLSPFEDKQLMTVDNHVGSPFQDRIYVTWTEFAANGTAYIYESHSNDYAQSFSKPVLVSQNSPLCTNTYGIPTPNGSCNENQFSQPFTGPDGALYVTWANFNNPTGHPVGDGGDNKASPAVNPLDNRNQILLAKSTDGGVSFSSPVKVSDYYDLPDCATYQNGQDAGRACVPEKGPTSNSVFRATNYPSGGVNPQNPKQIVVAFGSYINQHSNEANGCAPAGFSTTTGNNLFTGVKTPGACNNDILVSVSQNGGTSFTGTTTDPRQLTSATSAKRQTTTDQWWQWLDFNRNGKLAISYYDRQYGNDETTGFSDVSISGSNNASTFGVDRVTSGSMPPPTQFSGLFYGDYTGLAVWGNQAYPIWSDTRSNDLFLCPGTAAPGVPPQLCTASAPNAARANDQDVYTMSIDIPSADQEDNSVSTGKQPPIKVQPITR